MYKVQWFYLITKPSLQGCHTLAINLAPPEIEAQQYFYCSAVNEFIWRLWKCLQKPLVLNNRQTHTHTLRPLWGGLLSPEIIPRRWWWVWNIFMSIFFSVLPGSDINVLLLWLLFLRAFALPQVFAKAHQQTSYYSAKAEREARGVNVEIQKRKEID